MVQGPMRSPHDKAVKLAGAPSPGMRKRGYYEDGGVAGESGNAGAAGVGDGGFTAAPPVPVMAPPPDAPGDDLKQKPPGLNTGTPYTGVPKPKLGDAMRRGGRKRSSR